MTSKSWTIIEAENMAPVAHPGRLLRRELTTRGLSGNRLALDIGVPSGRVTDILNGRRSITADTAVRLGRYFGNSPQFWIDLQGQYDIARVEREHGKEIARRVRRADAAWPATSRALSMWRDFAGLRPPLTAARRRA